MLELFTANDIPQIEPHAPGGSKWLLWGLFAALLWLVFWLVAVRTVRQFVAVMDWGPRDIPRAVWGWAVATVALLIAGVLVTGHTYNVDHALSLGKVAWFLTFAAMVVGAVSGALAGAVLGLGRNVRSW